MDTQELLVKIISEFSEYTKDKEVIDHTSVFLNWLKLNHKPLYYMMSSDEQKDLASTITEVILALRSE